MYLGRLLLSIGQEVQAIEAIDKATKLAPKNSAHKVTLAQALMTTGDVNNLQRAQSILSGLLANTPGNDNLAFDGEGNLWVLQDGGHDYIWVVDSA